jgi:putative ABC transport system permease protein
VLTLAIGIGATSTVFTLVDNLVLRPLPFDSPEELVLLLETDPGLGEISVAYPDFLDWQERSTAFASMAAWRLDSCGLSGNELPEQVRIAEVSAELLPMFGITPIMGRGFLPEEDRPGADPVVLITYRFWQRRFAGDTEVVGRTILLDGQAVKVVGITPQHFYYPPDTPDLAIYRPIEQSSVRLDHRQNHPGILVTARLRSSVTIETARVEMAAIASQLEKEYPDTNTDQGVTVDRLQDLRVEATRAAMTTLLVSVALVMLIVCTNLAGLFLARGLSRAHELAVQSCLGASRGRLVRQLLAETAVLTTAGAALGIALANVAIHGIEVSLPEQITWIYFHSFRIDTGVLLFTAAVAVLSALAFGLAPALNACSVNLPSALKEAGRSSSEGPRRQRLRRVFVIAQVAFALVLLICAGLTLRSLYNTIVADPGYDPEGVLIAKTSLPAHRYPDGEACQVFFTGLEKRLRSLAGVEAVGLVNPLFGGWQDFYLVKGQPAQPPGRENWTDMKIVNPEYFSAMGIPLIEGRYFSEHDRKGSTPVAMIDEAMAEQWWPGQSAVGKWIRRGNNPDGDSPWLEIVGVVGHVKTYGVTQESRVTFYLPHLQVPTRFMAVVIKSALVPDTMVKQLRTEVSRLDPHQPVFEVRTLEQLIAEEMLPIRILAIILNVFAGTAILLAALGIYGLMAYNVGQRRHEIGIRLALGAEVSRVFGLVLRDGLRLAGIGLAAGLAIAATISPLLASLLFRVETRDPAIFGSAFLVLALVVIGACLVPACRASRVSPSSALRDQ